MARRPERSPLLQAIRAVALPLALLAASSAGGQPQSRTATPSAATVSAAPVRLYFYNATWPEVLSKVAEASGATLVMDQAPGGRWTRLDRRQYTRGDAVRILNRELEPLGYRILEKPDHLVVINLHDLRSEYRRPLTPTPPEPRPASRNEPPTVGAPPYSERAPRATGGIRHASHDAVDETGKVWSPQRAGDAPSENDTQEARRPSRATGPSVWEGAARVRAVPAVREQAPTKAERVELRHLQAVDLARTIYESVRPHAELVQAGPDGLPAFRVLDPAGSGPARSGAPRVDYAIGIDSEANELIVESHVERVPQIVELIAALDAPADPSGRQTRFVPVRGDVQGVGKGVRQAVERILAQREQPEPQRNPPPNNQPPRQPPATEPGAVAEQPPSPEPPPVQINLTGPVTVRDVPGVGLVLIGAKADTEAVMNFIRVMQLAGTGVTPKIELVPLRNVNSEALAELLNNLYDEYVQIRSPVATQIQQQTQRNVRVVPVVKPNAVLIVAPAREMVDALALARALDEPVDPQTEVQVFPLEHAIASQVVTNIDTFYQTRAPLGTRVRAVADVRTNSVIVYARPNDLDEVGRLIEKIDRDTSGSVSRMRIFPLRNATATELATLINTAIQSVVRPPTTGQQGQFQQAADAAGGQTPQQLRDVKSAILEFLSSDGDRGTLLRSGILTDIRVTADAGRNALIVSAPEQSMPLMEALIAQLDQPTPLVAEIKVFTLSNSDATATAELLRALFTGQTQQQGGFGQFGQLGQLQQGGVQLAGAEGAGAGLIPLRFSVDARTNTIIAIGNGDALQIVEAILLRLDESDTRQRRNIVVKLRNTFANDIALAINQFLTAQRSLAQVDPNLITTVELLEREIIVVPEIVSNSLLISATPRYFDEITKLVDDLDQRPPEVVIQGLLVEVDLTNNDEYGVELGFQDNILFNRSVNGVPGFLFNNQQLGNNVSVPGSGQVGSQGLSNFSLNRTNNDLGFGGLVLAASSESVSVLIRALSSKRTVHVLSRPQIRTLDNQIAQILVGQQVPVATGVTTTGLNAASPTVQLRDVGILLNVVPRISPDGTIVMEVVAQRSSLSATRVPIFTDINTGNVVDSPVINITTAQATVSVPNGQTVVLGGMITKADDAFERKVPWLGDLPYLGNVFRYEGVNTRRTELLIFLTPRVVRHEADSELIKRVEAERLHFIERDAEEVHGPLYSAPPPEWYLNRPMPGDGTCLPTFDESAIPTTLMPAFPGGGVTPLRSGEIRSEQMSPDVLPTPPPPLPQPQRPPEGPAPPGEARKAPATPGPYLPSRTSASPQKSRGTVAGKR